VWRGFSLKIIDESEGKRISNLLWAELNLFTSKVYAARDSMASTTEALSKLDLAILRAARIAGYIHELNAPSRSGDLAFSREYPLLSLLMLIRFPSLFLREDTRSFTFLSHQSKDRALKIFRLIRRLVSKRESRIEYLVPMMIRSRSIYGETYLFEFKRENKVEDDVRNEYQGAFPAQFLKAKATIENSIDAHYSPRLKSPDSSFSDLQSLPASFYYLLYSVNLAKTSRFTEELVFYFWHFNRKARTNRRAKKIWGNFERVLTDKILPYDFIHYDTPGEASLVMPKVSLDEIDLAGTEDTASYLIKEWKEYSAALQLNERPPIDTLYAFQIFWKAVVAECGIAWNYDENHARVNLRNLVFSLKDLDPDLFQLIVIISPASYYPLDSFPTALTSEALYSSSYTLEEKEYYQLVISFIDENCFKREGDFKLLDLDSLVSYIPSPILSYYSIEEPSVRNSNLFPYLSPDLRKVLGELGLYALSYGLVRDLSTLVKGSNGLDGEWGKGLIRLLKDRRPDLYSALIT